MTTEPGLTLEQRIAAHPIPKAPYSKVRFLRKDGNGVALYEVVTPQGLVLPAKRADHALADAARQWTVHCYYHGAACPDNLNAPLRRKRQRDHVLPVKHGGRHDLHNLVLCCEHFNSRKGATALCDIAPASAQRYLEELSGHLSRVIQAI